MGEKEVRADAVIHVGVLAVGLSRNPATDHCLEIIEDVVKGRIRGHAPPVLCIEKKSLERGLNRAYFSKIWMEQRDLKGENTSFRKKNSNLNRAQKGIMRKKLLKDLQTQQTLGIIRIKNIKKPLQTSWTNRSKN